MNGWVYQDVYAIQVQDEIGYWRKRKSKLEKKEKKKENKKKNKTEEKPITMFFLDRLQLTFFMSR